MKRLLFALAVLSVLSVFSLFSVFSLGPPAPARAQPESRPAWVLVSSVQVKPEMRQEWLDLQKNHVSRALKKAGVPYRAVWETVVGDTHSYYSVTPLKNFAQLDDPGPLRRALEPEERVFLLQKLSKCLKGRRRTVGLVRKDLSITTEGQRPATRGVVVKVTLVPGKQAEFEHLMKAELLPALKKAGVDQFFANQVVFGDDPNQFVFLRLVPNFAKIDAGPPLVQALGQEGAQALAAKFAGIVASIDYSLMRLNTKLSFGGE